MTILWQIFWVFFKINMLSFGGVFGVLPELERMIVVEHGWMNHERFIQSYVVSQFAPGPNMAMCPLIGYWVAGWPGWVAGFLGIYVGPFFVMALAFLVFGKYRSIAWVHRIETGFQPLVLGLLVASGARLWWSQSAGLDPGATAAAVLWQTRLAAGFITAIGIYVYMRGWVGSMKLVFAVGGLWWVVNRLVL